MRARHGRQKKEDTVRPKQTASQTDGVEYRQAKTWQIALTMMSNSLSMTFYTLIGYMSYLANEGYGDCPGRRGRDPHGYAPL